MNRGALLFVIGLFFGAGVGFYVGIATDVTLPRHDHADHADHADPAAPWPGTRSTIREWVSPVWARCLRSR